MIRLALLTLIVWTVIAAAVVLYSKLKRSRLVSRLCCEIVADPTDLVERHVVLKQDVETYVELTREKLEADQERLHAVESSLKV